MFVTINDQSIFYQRNTYEEKPIILLHGWECNGYTMRCIFNFFTGYRRSVFALDLCGFGRSEKPKKPMTIYDYADIVEKFIKRFCHTKPDIIAHSFGGRIALILASKNLVNKMIITGGAGLKPRFSLVKFARKIKYKLSKKLGKRTDKSGSADYKKTSGVMRATFVSVVNTHLDGLLDKIETPTLLIWGRNDNQTPLYMARRMNKKVKNSRLIVLNNSGHFAFLDEPTLFLGASKRFLLKE
ncbi:MAG: alpha/beta hydrolase [Clostridia bacterium]|nr:alpha/beta hydrolase [Clostridia bacterium]